MPATMNGNKIHSEADVFNSVKGDVKIHHETGIVVRTMHYLEQDRVSGRRCPKSDEVRTKRDCGIAWLRYRLDR